MVRNRENVKPDKVSPETTIVVSVNGIAITGYLDSANAEFLDLQGVVFHACANAMRANHISESSYLNK